MTKPLKLITRLSVLAVLLVIGSIVRIPEVQAAPQTFTVNSLNDGIDINPGDNICQTSTPGECTLRAAIGQSNSNGNPADQDVIEFDIPGTGPHKIILTDNESLLVEQSLYINGYSEPGAVTNTNPNPQPLNGTLMIEVDGTESSTAGGVITVYSNDVRISGLTVNNGDAAQILTGDFENIEISGNYLGTDVTGMIPIYDLALTNGASGTAFSTFSSNNLTLGGPSPADRNVIFSYGDTGLGTQPGDTSLDNNTVVQGNNFYVGSDSVTPLAPRYLDFTSSIVIGNSKGVTFGGDNTGEGNLVENLTGSGLIINDGAEDIIIAGNRIVGNGQPGNNNSSGINIYGGVKNVRIGGSSVYSRNVIADSMGNGINIDGNSEDINILGNYIGVHEDGVSRLENGVKGIYVRGSSNINIGSSVSGGRNVISGRTGDSAIELLESNNVRIQNNIIGLGVDETTELPNNTGIYINDTSEVLVGGAGANEGNIITNSTEDGISLVLDGTQDVAILGNRIYENDDLGIDIQDNGPNINDRLDPDSGPNSLLNYPTVYTPEVSGGNTDVMYGIDVPAGDYRIELFSNTTAGSSGFGQGEELIGTQNSTSNGVGLQVFNITLAGTSFTNIRATATLIDSSNPSGFGPTSEFGNLTLPPADIEATKTIADINNVIPGGIVEYDLSFINNGPMPAELADFEDANSGERLFLDVVSPDLIPTDEGAPGPFPGAYAISDTGNSDVGCVWLGAGSAGSVYGIGGDYADHGIIICWYAGSDAELPSGESLDISLRFTIDNSSDMNFKNYVVASPGSSTSDPDLAALGSASQEDLLDQSVVVNNVAVAKTTGGVTDLSVSKGLVDPEDFVQGGEITYSLAINNLGPDWYDPSQNSDFFTQTLIFDFVPPDITPVNLGGPGPFSGITMIADTGNPDVECFWAPHGSAPSLGAIDHTDYGAILCRYIGNGIIRTGEALEVELDFQISGSSDLAFENYAFAPASIATGDDPDNSTIVAVYGSGSDVLTGLLNSGINNLGIAYAPGVEEPETPGGNNNEESSNSGNSGLGSTGQNTKLLIGLAALLSLTGIGSIFLLKLNKKKTLSS